MKMFLAIVAIFLSLTGVSFKTKQVDIFAIKNINNSSIEDNETSVNADIKNENKQKITQYDGELAHFFTHALIAYPKIAFAPDNTMRTSYDLDCLTVNEFKDILYQLYIRQFALVDICETYGKNADGYIVKKPFAFPKGKKPLIFSFDDINYYIKKMNKGMNDKIILDSEGKLATYTENATHKINYDNEVVTVLENFIQEHPDFSFRGARGMICLTGFDGILGYRTQSGSQNIIEEIKYAKKVVSSLKDKGWRIACHSYGHYHMKSLSVDRFIADTNKWINEVSPIVGKTDIYVYPYGEYEILAKNEISLKHKYLLNCGFNLYCGVGLKPFFANIPYGSSPPKNYALIMDRKPLDGRTLRQNPAVYTQYFACEKIYDDNVRFVAFPHK